MTHRRRLAFVLILASAAMLVACAMVPETRVTRLPSDGPGRPVTASPTASPTSSLTPSPPPTSPASSIPAGSATDCGGRPMLLDAGSESWEIAGDCPDVQIQGSELVIDAADASVAVLVVSGDRISVRVGVGGQVTIQGNDVFVDAGRISSLTVRGDRNTVESAGGIEGVLLQGNDNAVRGAVGQVSDEGSRNAVG